MEEKMEYKRKEWLCARCANQCKADGGMDYCEKFLDKEEAERIVNVNKIAELSKRCEWFMQGIVRDFGDIIVADTACIKETEQKNADFNRVKNIAYVEKSPLVDFNLAFTVYNKD